MPLTSLISQMNVPSTVANGLSLSRPRSKKAARAVRVGLPAGRCWASRKDHRKRLSPHVATAGPISTGVIEGAVAGAPQPSRLSGTLGATWQAAVPLAAGPLACGAVVVAEAVGFEHAAATKATSTR